MSSRLSVSQKKECKLKLELKRINFFPSTSKLWSSKTKTLKLSITSSTKSLKTVWAKRATSKSVVSRSSSTRKKREASTSFNSSCGQATPAKLKHYMMASSSMLILQQSFCKARLFLISWMTCVKRGNLNQKFWRSFAPNGIVKHNPLGRVI